MRIAKRVKTFGLNWVIVDGVGWLNEDDAVKAGIYCGVDEDKITDRYYLRHISAKPDFWDGVC